MMLMFVGAGRLSQGIPARDRHDACLLWAMLLNHSLLLLVGLTSGRCSWGMLLPSKAWCLDQSWTESLFSLRRWTSQVANWCWIYRAKGGETLRILPDMLVLVHMQDQEMLRLRCDSS